MKFPEFNATVNPTNDKCYSVRTSNGLMGHVTFEEAKVLAADLDSAIYWTIPKGFLIIRTTCKAVIDTIIARNEEVLVVETPACYEIYCKSNFFKNTANNVLACGADADTLGYSSSDTTILLPFKMKKNTCPLYNGVKVVHSNGLGMIPLWLSPTFRRSSNSRSGLLLPIQQDTSNELIALYKKLKDFNEGDKKNILSIVNEYMCQNKLTPNELDNIFSISQNAITDTFFDKNSFLHYKFGDYIIDNCHIKRDSVTNNLYYYDYKRNVYVQDKDFLMGYMTRLCPQLKDHQKDETIKYINNYLYEDMVAFNETPTTIVFKNGILDVADMSFEPMTPEKLESIQIDANYNPNAYSATADEFFQTITGGDIECKQVLLEAIGYSLLKTTELQKTFMLVGSGKNGKSTYLDLLKHILGVKNYAAISMKDLSNNFRVSMLEGKLASIAADISSAPLQDTDLFKNIVSGDEITIEKKYQDAKLGKFFATMLFACNKLPRTTDTSDGYYRRWVIVPFNANLKNISSVEGANFKKKLLAQDSIDYIAYLAVKAISVVINTTLEFTQPQCVKDMLNEYRIDNSSVLSWIKEEFPNGITEYGINMVGSLESFGLSSNYSTYKQWCLDSGRKSSSKATFRNEIKAEYGVELK